MGRVWVWDRIGNEWWWNDASDRCIVLAADWWDSCLRENRMGVYVGKDVLLEYWMKCVWSCALNTIQLWGIYHIIHLFYHFTKSYYDRLYHFVWIYYIIHLKIPYLISSVSFVMYYNIIQMNYNIIHFWTWAHAIVIFYSTCRTPSRTSTPKWTQDVELPWSLSLSMFTVHRNTSVMTITPLCIATVLTVVIFFTIRQGWKKPYFFKMKSLVFGFNH